MCELGNVDVPVWLVDSTSTTQQQSGSDVSEVPKFEQRKKFEINRAFVAALLLGMNMSLTSCMTASDRLEKKLRIGEPKSQVFFAKYEEVEAALKLTMLKYPQRVDNTEAGIFETDFVKGDLRFKPPQKATDYSSGYRYRILIRLVRGKSTARPAIEVVVLKQTEVAKDFFAEPAPIPSDGLEESVILYRIGRELVVSKALQKLNEKKKTRS